jgi:molybdopterin-guanine dinucleotide biosynthesis protein A
MGQDKGLLKVSNQYLIEHALKAAYNTVPKVCLLTSNSEYGKFGFELVSDIVSNLGPLGGIYTALMHSEHDQVLILPCDTPNITDEAVNYFLQASIPNHSAIASYKEKLHPVFAKYHKSLLPNLKKCLELHQLKVQDFVLKNEIATIPFEKNFESSLFHNINTPNDLLLYSQKMKQIKVVPFGKIHDIVTSSKNISFEGNNLLELKKLLFSQHPNLENEFFQMAINHHLSNDMDLVKDGDEIALLPPFSGG